MATYAEIMAAAANADAQGDTEAAKQLVGMAMAMQQPQSITPRLPEEKQVAEEAKSRSWLERNLAGLGSSAAQTYYGVKQLLPGGLSPQDVQSVKDWRAIAEEAPVGKFAGDVAQFAIPTSKVLKGVTSLKGMMAGGAGVGAAEGFLQPVIGNESQIQNTLTSGALGAATPLALSGASKYVVNPIINTLAPYSANMREVVQGRILNKAVGADKQQAVINALESAKPSLPNAPITAGEASLGSGSTAIPAMEVALTKRRLPDEWEEIKSLQASARSALIKPADKTALESARDTVTTPLREFSLTAANRANALAKHVPSIAPLKAADIAATIDQKILDPEIVATQSAKALGAIRDRILANADANGNINANTLYSLRKEAELIAEGLAESKDVGGVKKFASGVVRSVKPIFDDAMDSASSGSWRKYLNTYGEMSKQIDRAKVMQELNKALDPRLQGADQRAAVFANVINEPKALIQKALGEGRYTKLEDVLTPTQMDSIQKIGENLNRQSRVKELAKTGKSKVEKLLVAEEQPIQGINVLSRPIAIATQVLRRLQTGASERTYEDLAKTLQDPVKTAQLMKLATAKEKAAITYLRKSQAFTSPIIPTFNTEQ